MRSGVSASRTWLPKSGSSKNATEVYGSWDTILDFLIDRFPFISEEIFRGRLIRGDIVNESGKPYQADSPYVAESFLFYYREIPDEPAIPFTETVLFKDDHIIVVDKPHFIPVTPTGRYVKESLLSRLKHQFQIEDISPIHRLDRETAGVMLFSCDKNGRAGYQSLFQNRQVSKTYEAIAPRSTLEFPYIHRSRMTKGDPFFRMQESDGEPNSETSMDVLETKGELARYLLKPVSGKQHQLRVHLASIGCPILNDPFYPDLLPSKEDDYSQPLQLLAKSIEFVDPISGELRRFDSELSLKL
jgi:tRNA pseudouridine32 synthase/23S rRNA pseudouridine746 synthase